MKRLENLAIILGPVLFIVFLLTPHDLTPQQTYLGAIMLWVICWWLSATIPLPITGLIGISLATIMGVVDFAKALEGFANPVIFLFMGGFFIAQALQSNNLDTWIAQRFLSMKLIRGNPQRLYLAITFLVALFSMFLSNTATTAMFIPIALSLFHHLEIKEGDPSAKLMLMIPWAATIGGVATPIGSTPNVLGISLLSKSLNIQISFIEWMIKALPLMLLSLLGMAFFFRKELRVLILGSGIRTQSAPALNKGQKRLLLMVILTIGGWMLPGLLQITLGAAHPVSVLITKRIPEGLVAIFMSSLLFLIPADSKRQLLNWSEAKNIDWGTLLLFGSGISLGIMMFDSGLARVLGDLLPFQKMSYPMALLVVISATLFFTEIASNTATANLIIPVLLSTAPFDGAPIVSVMCVAMAANMAFMLPVGTPPNAIAYGTGLVKLPWMITKGIWLNLMCIFLIWLMGLYWF
jgi:solute carrier family 13 (sodium-dependent dicarboxylate transporter), member 2/3/5